MTITIGAKLICGIQKPLPLCGFPEGTTRIRMRGNEIVQVYVRPPAGGIIAYAVIKQNNTWRPGFKLGWNARGVPA